MRLIGLVHQSQGGKGGAIEQAIGEESVFGLVENDGVVRAFAFFAILGGAVEGLLLQNALHFIEQVTAASLRVGGLWRSGKDAFD